MRGLRRALATSGHYPRTMADWNKLLQWQLLPLASVVAWYDSLRSRLHADTHTHTPKAQTHSYGDGYHCKGSQLSKLPLIRPNHVFRRKPALPWHTAYKRMHQICNGLFTDGFFQVWTKWWNTAESKTKCTQPKFRTKRTPRCTRMFSLNLWKGNGTSKTVKGWWEVRDAVCTRWFPFLLFLFFSGVSQSCRATLIWECFWKTIYILSSRLYSKINLKLV